MVAYTSPDCLPYFECTDLTCLNTGTVCDPSTVWCDQATLVEARLDEIDSIVARTASAVPLAWVETTTPFTLTQAGPFEVYVPFTTVIADTDNMVNLDANNTGFSFSTPGLYMFTAWTRATTDTSFGAGTSIEGNLTLLLNDNPAVYPFQQNFRSAAWGLFINDQIVGSNLHFIMPVTAAGASVAMTVSATGPSPRSVVYSQVTLSAAWMGDLP